MTFWEWRAPSRCRRSWYRTVPSHTDSVWAIAQRDQPQAATEAWVWTLEFFKKHLQDEV